FFRSFTISSATAPTWRWERPVATTMRSAIELLAVRSMVTMSSAFMSSRRARTILCNVSVGIGRETKAGERGAARESACVDRGIYPFCLSHSPPALAGAFFKIDSRRMVRYGYALSSETLDLVRVSSPRPQRGRGQGRFEAVQERPGRRLAVGQAHRLVFGNARVA